MKLSGLTEDFGIFLSADDFVAAAPEAVPMGGTTTEASRPPLMEVMVAVKAERAQSLACALVLLSVTETSC